MSRGGRGRDNKMASENKPETKEGEEEGAYSGSNKWSFGFIVWA